MLDIKSAVPVSEFTLSNGLKVVIINNPKVPVVCFTLGYKTGSKNEHPGKSGMAHLFEHLMFEGSKHLPKGYFDRYCSMAGGTNNAYTSFDITAYEMALPAHQIELGLWLESDRMLEFSVTEESLKTQQKVVIEEIRQTVDDQPYAKWREELSLAAYTPECSYSWEVHGTKEDVASIKLSDVREFFNEYYQTDNACLALSGNILPEEGYRLAEKYFGEIPLAKNHRRDIIFKEEFRKKNQYVTFEDNIPFPAVFLAFHCPGFIDDNIYAADIISNVLGSGRSSRLYRSLAYEKQIVSSSSTYVDKRELSSLFILYAVANSPDITCDRMADEILNEVKILLNEGIKEAEFQKAINQLTTQAAYEIQFSSGLADIMANQVLFWNDPKRLYSLLDRYRNLSIPQINDYARQLLNIDEVIRIDAIPVK